MLKQIRLLILITLAMGGSYQPADAAAKPNVLFLICDDLNCDIGCYGHPQVKTPNIDRLAKRGVRFKNAYCQYPLCGPSRASFMTGMYPDQTLVRTNPVFVRQMVPNVVTLSQLFRQNGYFATRIGKIFHYGVPGNIGSSGHDDPYSWDLAINPRGRDKDDEPLIFSVKPGEYGGYLSWLAAEGEDREQTDGIAVRTAARLIAEYGKTQKPFFLAVGLYRPHTPYVAPQKYFDLYPPEEMTIPEVPEGYLKTLPVPAQKKLTKKKEHFNLSKPLARQAKQAYYAAVTFADAQIGIVLEALEQAGLSDDTIIVFTSDHGYHLGEHRHWLKTTLFENAARIPLIIAGPGIQAKGQSTSSLAELTDLYPTLAELCELEPPANLSGVSQAKTLSDPSRQARTSALTQLKLNYSIRTPQFRYTEWGPQGTEGVELYDHQSDPEEMKNLAENPEYEQVRQKLSRLLRQRVVEANRAPAGIKQVHFVGD
ncbi:Choline-sulfatase [Gimesia panareensis]|uniref:Choline-sulfatase n=1 Tax=Gimesia panareensis TaxID=2527978 RepID=A0A518FLG3_9PLAN|nr:sulfatase [Gimesia panareensis]QDV17202.1 Choline-sulfatase [Gimesia panareensis]